MKGVSIIVCCYNSVTRLTPTLAHLAKQDFQYPWEVIIVDNASTDGTGNWAAQEWSRFNLSSIGFKVVQESNPGLSSARKKGVLESQYEYILFCDDDNWLTPNYVSTAFLIMEENPEIGLLGGRNLLASDVPPPPWFFDYSMCFAIGEQGKESGDITETKENVWGAGMVIRTKILKEVFELDYQFTTSDRKGASLVGGGDWEISYLARFMGYKFWYSSELVLHHYMPETRFQRKYLLKLVYSFGLSDVHLQHYYYFVKDKNLTTIHPYRLILAQTKPFVSSLIKWVIGKDRLRNQAVIHVVAGKVVGLLRYGNLIENNYKLLQNQLKSIKFIRHQSVS